jgi:hypothetical protein
MIYRFLLFALFLIPAAVTPQRHSAELVLQETSITLDKGKLHKMHHFEIRINNRLGEKYAHIKIPCSNLNKVQNIDAHILDRQGKMVRKLKRREIIEKSAISSISFYEDDIVKEFILKHNDYPYTIVYSYEELQSVFLSLVYWMPVIGLSVPTAKAILNLNVSNDFEFSYTSNLETPPEKSLNNNATVYSWQAGYSGLIHEELMAPPFQTFLPLVKVVPQEFNFEMPGSLESWADFGNWHFELLRDIDVLPDQEIYRIKHMIKEVEDKRELVRRLYHYLQDETRYVNVSIETGGLKPYPASYVAEKKYGDCKALTNYFRAVLDVAGIPSFYTTIYAGTPILEIDKSFPSQQMNHVILCVPCNGDTLWLDCTSKGPFGYPGTFNQNRDALVIAENNSHFAQIPALAAKEVLETRKMDITFRSKRPAAVVVQNTCRGKKFEMLLEMNYALKESEKLWFVKNNIIEKGFELTSYTINHPDRDTTWIALTYTADAPGIFTQYDNEILVSNIPITLPRFERPENRKLPVQIDYPVYKMDTIIYRIPSNALVNPVQNSQSVNTRFGYYETEFIHLENAIQVIKTLLINEGCYSREEYEEYYDFIVQVKSLEERTHLVFTVNQ